MYDSSRRTWLRCVALGVAGAVCRGTGWAVAQPVKPRACTLSIGTYSLKGLSIEEGIKLVAATGYDGLEIAVQPGQDGEPSRMPPARCQDIRSRLTGTGLKLTALMEQITPAEEGRQQSAERERLQRVTDLCHALAPAAPPLVQTVLGGGDWEKKRQLFRDRLGEWLQVTKKAGLVLAIKPHRGGALSRPSEAIWLIQQLGNTPWLRMVYDYSHYAFRDMPLAQTVKESLPYTAHVAVKDVAQREGRMVFLLPGEAGTVDYPQLLRLLYEGGYRGDFCCEVSSMVSKQPGYDPAAAAQTCYRNMAQAFREAKVSRETKSSGAHL